MKLLATDMDGTILDENNEIPEDARQLIEDLYQRGVLTCFVTGRMWKSPAWYAKRFSFQMPLISCNGGVVHDARGRIIKYHPLPADLLEELIDFCREEEAFFQCYNLDALYLSGISLRTLRRYAEGPGDFSRLQAPVIIDENPLDRLVKGDDPAVKFVIMDEDTEKLQEIRHKIEKRTGIHVAKSHYNNLEITARGATKGEALRELADSLGIAKKDVVVIGDNENDIPMFAHAGLSIGVEGGSALVPEQADVLAQSPLEGGWTRAIRTHVWEKLA